MDSPLPTSLVEDWTAVLATHRHTTLGKSCDKVFDHPVLFPLQRRRELEAMLALMQSTQVIMEIGADKGGGVYHWLAATLARPRDDARNCGTQDLTPGTPQSRAPEQPHWA